MSAADPTHFSTDALAIGLIAAESVIRSNGFASRIGSLPRCACLTPLFSIHPPAHAPTRPATPSISPVSSPTAPSPSIALSGDGQNGLLISRHSTVSLWRNRRAITCSQEAEHGFAGGRPSGILLKRDQQILSPAFPPPDFSPSDSIHLFCEDLSICISPFRTSGWNWTLEQSPSAVTDFRFILCPVSPKGKPIRLTTLPEEAQNRIRLLIEPSAALSILIEVSGLKDAFTYADSSPLPQGEHGLDSIFTLSGTDTNGMVYTPTCILGGVWSSPRLTARLLVGATPAEVLQLADRFAQSSSVSPVLSPPRETNHTLLLSYYLSFLFRGLPLPRLTAISHLSLAHSITRISAQLEALGFPIASTLPTPLTVSPREGVQGLLYRLLRPTPLLGETPMLPYVTAREYPHGYVQLTRGRDCITHSYPISNGLLTVDADPSNFHVQLDNDPAVLKIAILWKSDGIRWLLPDGAKSISYLPGKICYMGEGYTLTLSLLSDYPCILLELQAIGEGEIVFPTLPPADCVTDQSSFWHLSGDNALFLHALPTSTGQVWMIGCFHRKNDAPYYQMIEQLTFRTFRSIRDIHCEKMKRNAEFLRLDAANPLPSLPAIALFVLSSRSPVKALLSPLCTPDKAREDLLGLAKETDSLLLPAALPCYRSVFPKDADIAQTAVPTVHGSESLYLHAARCLEAAMEAAPQTLLLPQLVQAFANLAEAYGDPAASLYRSFHSSSPSTYPTSGKDPYWQCKHATISCLAALHTPSDDSFTALWKAIETQLIHPSPEDSALLWCGVLWTLLGFRIKQGEGTFTPMTVPFPCTARVAFGKCCEVTLPSPTAPAPLLFPYGDENEKISKKLP